MKKWFVLIFYFIIFIWGISNHDLILNWLQDREPSYLVVIMILSVFIATIPVIPFTLFGGIVGVKYGLLLGAFINWFGGFIAALIYYLLARFILSESFLNKVKSFKQTEKFHLTLQKNHFLSILIFRLIPIIPPVAIHIYSGISHISLSIYLIATAIGLIPSMFILAFGGNQLFTNFPQFLVGLAIYILFVITIYISFRLWSRKRVNFAGD